MFNSNLNRGEIQLKMDFNIDFVVEGDLKLLVLKNIVKEIDLSFIKNSYSHKGRKPAVDPITMFQILIYCYSEGVRTSREIEKLCKYDLRIIYLLEGTKAPDHSTISRFRNRLEPFVEKALFNYNMFLIDNDFLDISSLYIDGTKIEADANRYTFVWKKSVLKFREKLIKKVIKNFNIADNTSVYEIIKFLKFKKKGIEEVVNSKNISFVYGKGKRKIQTQLDYELVSEYLRKLEEYEKHLEIMGERNSYSKTDHDATFMRLKDDHMKNGQLKPAYNIQLATSGNFVVDVFGSNHTSDMYTLPLFLNKIYPKYLSYMDKIVCDAGYESEENYEYLDKKKLRAFIKPSNYEISKKRKYKKSQEFRENLIYNEKQDYYETLDGKVFVRISDRKKTKKSGYVSTSKVYKCFDWNQDGFKTKSIWFTERFEKYRNMSLENITSIEGIEERVNRSIQAEGAFSKLKDGIGYERFNHTGLKNIINEMTLMAIAMNLNTLTNKIFNMDYGPTRYEISEEKVA